MIIKEQSSIGKYFDQSLNEDALVVTDHYIAVIDGATSSGADWGMRGGLLATRLLEDYIGKAGPLKNGFDFILALNSVLYEYQSVKPSLFVYPEKRLMASVLVFSVENRQLWGYGDCHYLINNEYHKTDKRVDVMNAAVRSYIDHYHLMHESTEADLLICDKGADAIKLFLSMQPQFANKKNTFGYPILDGGSLDPSFFVSYQLQDGDFIVMATDGYPFLESTLKKSEERLHELKKTDPLLISDYQAVKGFYSNQISFDDRTYISFIV